MGTGASPARVKLKEQGEYFPYVQHKETITALFLFLMKATIKKAVNFKLVINGSMEFLVILKLKIPSMNRRNCFVKNAL